VESVPNRLASATSPYLLQHADNPVDWWEWGPEPFEEARRRGVPVLLSVGYAACHWCHVMAHESFEDEGTAAQLNADFVSIKVDREERPDVDAIYMQATTAMTGHGGWPMTCVLDHDGNPFFTGTYFPDRPRHGQPAFRQVLAAVTEAWRERGDDVRRVTASVREHLNRVPATAPASVDAPKLAHAVATLAQEYDQTNAGFGGAPKFPPSMVLEFLARHAARTGDRAAERMHDETLEAMARGGLHDQLGGGFARYSVDAGWVVPHFEKMLYDNALLLRVYAATRSHIGAWVAEGVAGFLLRELRTAEGGFASALDADSEGVEGRFYVWTPAQLVDVLGEADGRWAAELLEVTDGGTFEDGASTLQLRRDPDDLERWFDVQRRLLAARDERVRPARDDKVVAAWNGLAISGLVELHRWLGDDEHLDAAVAAGVLLTAGCEGCRATASSAPRRGCSRTTPASQPASSTSCRRHVTRSGSSAQACCLRSPSTGFERTTAASSTPPTTPSSSSPGRGTPPTTPARRACRRWCTPSRRTAPSPAPAATPKPPSGRWPRCPPWPSAPPGSPAGPWPRRSQC
jgi:uncharacterized protein